MSDQVAKRYQRPLRRRTDPQARVEPRTTDKTRHSQHNSLGYDPQLLQVSGRGIPFDVIKVSLP